MPRPRRLGSDAEDLAADFLIGQGYTIITRRFKARSGEIDVIALDGDVLVFVEVKFRSALDEAAEEALTVQKKSRLIAASREYRNKMGADDRDVRYDLIAIDPHGIRHHIGAFEP
jgi:putative endonuclease